MAVCTFFGHRDCPSTVKPKMREALVELIEHGNVDTFYVGNHGAFDAMAQSLLSELKQTYPHIRYTIVLAYMPQKRIGMETLDYTNTMLPEGIEMVPKRFAISWRNKWMLRRAEYVVTYVVHSLGGAWRFAEMAEKQGKIVVKIG